MSAMIGPAHWSKIDPASWPSRYFDPREFACKGGEQRGVVLLHRDLLQWLNAIRRTVNGPIIIRSGFRAPDWNARIRGAVPNSQHVLGRAADITTAGRAVRPSWALAKTAREVAEELGWAKQVRVIEYPTFVHCDVRGRP